MVDVPCNSCLFSIDNFICCAMIIQINFKPIASTSFLKDLQSDNAAFRVLCVMFVHSKNETDCCLSFSKNGLCVGAMSHDESAAGPRNVKMIHSFTLSNFVCINVFGVSAVCTFQPCFASIVPVNNSDSVDTVGLLLFLC